MGEFVPRPKTLGGDIPCLDSPELARKRQKALSARAELRAERLLRAEPNLETTVETQADGAPLFRISDLSAGYDKKVVVEGVDLEVRAGDVVALIGPNGSGKSTILKTITRHLAPLAGAVELAEDAELPEVADGVAVEPLGTTVEGYVIDTGSEVIELSELQEAWESGIEGVFTYRSAGETPEVETIDFRAKDIHVYGGAKIARPRVIIPVFPGNNCEYDSARAFRAAGAEADTFVINNLTPEAVAESTHELARRIRQSQIVMIPGGFSGGDEPDGSAKFITAFFRAPEVTEAVRDLLKARDGLMLGICNGFQALIKLGLVPYGDIVDATPDAPTLTFNTIGRHQSRLVQPVPVAFAVQPGRPLHRRHQPRRGPLCRQ